MEYIIEVYQTREGKLPFSEWLRGLDLQVRQKIRMRIERLGLGNFGNCESVDEGIFEIKMDWGPGYRVYYSRVGSNILLILFAGTKRTQQRDIEKAKKYLKDFKGLEKRHAKK